ncbi:MAG: glycosyltransferase, partial [Acidimicrobiales bacterium]
RSPGKWWNDDGGPRIYMTFGTVLGFMSIARDVYQTALRAIEGLGGQVLLTVGHRFDASTLADVPPNVRVEAWVDQAEVLAEADLVVCHGGSGTVFGSLGAGVPVVTIPAFADQFENGRRVAAVGAGLAVEAQGAVDEGRPLLRPEEAPCITAAIMSVLETAAFRDAARIIAAEMVATPTAEEVMAELISLGPQS